MFTKSTFKALFLLSTLTLFCYGQPDNMARIHGGRNATQKDWYFMVALYGKSLFSTICKPFISQRCGGVIISKWVVLTAAHCLHHMGKPKKPKDIVVVGGSMKIIRWMEKKEKNKEILNMGGQQRFVKSLKIHPTYNYSNAANDIGILILKKPFAFESEKIGSISLERKDQVPEGKMFY